MPPFRLVVRGSQAEDEHAIDLDQDVVLLGRRPGLDVVLPHPDVGGVHARLERRDRELFLVDAGAGTTELAGELVPAGTRRPLRDGVEVVVARRFRIRIEVASPDGARPTTRAETADLARKMVQNALAALGTAEPDRTPYLDVVGGPGLGRRLLLTAPGQDFVLGRGESCDLAIVDADLSREHVRIRRTWSGTLVADLGSKNGTLHNDEPIPTGEEVRLAHGDHVSAGRTHLVFRDPVEEYLQALEPRRARFGLVAWIGLAAVAAAIAGLVWIFLV